MGLRIRGGGGGTPAEKGRKCAANQNGRRDDGAAVAKVSSKAGSTALFEL